MTDIELGWLAGIIDGEGCLHIRRERPKVVDGGQRSATYAFVIKVTMCHRETIERIKDLVGVGHINQTTNASGRVHNAWSWVAMSHEAKKVLDQIAPFLFTKQGEARVALEFMALPTGRHGQKHVMKELTEQRDGLYWKMRMLKPVNDGIKESKVTK